jgi:broad specificity phosphatase PhoE
MKTKTLLKSAILLLFTFGICSCTGTFYIVRHAEKLNSSDDTPLSSAGLQRAETLADSLITKGVDSIFASTRLRTQQTARPLALRLNKQVKIYGLDSVASFTHKIKKLKKTVLIVSHTNFIPQIVNILSGQTIDPIAESDYDNFYKVTIRRSWHGQISKSFKPGTYGILTP